MRIFFKIFNRDEKSMKLKKLEKLLRRVNNNHIAIDEHNHRYYSIYFNDYSKENNKKYIMNISSQRCIILQTIYFDEAAEVALYLEMLN